ncbi:tRNA (adenosine(37)-N6)-threonylcarbamoyltransferase complex dimerization subunit type 1 TsaB [Spiractinospora alimapuensis]|uniref:tRNA (adenosine(37)-N6)-threonylcarbamoyltransferase complex dimerization subunit type 1 TsaB n=1 Tax=Spiractinospora alimapuensis TaxID=2820884 RepID=UPI001EEBF9AD|nr:tRNA (adenosine(37)-N6)-threonylcarbamoyltransferase complex dimerization subunit type 1 TsaB [Spiractinospora alimapuensis]QVQ55039.1 tRNA (adenosine(37)-N6)-threonylcarbamoyltransferase complex dimerization subunit type 1 TsaB [Spiractinospora alimapuensis]
MLLLAFDTATPAVTVAVCSVDGGDATVRAERTSVDARRHGELLAPSIADVVRAAGATMTDLTHIAVGIGPGPYTGLRVGLATAHALRDALGIPCVGVPTLDALAKSSGRTEPFVAATDARRKEVFWARYTDADTRVGDIAVDRPADVETGGLPVIGAGAALYPETLGAGQDSWEPTHPTAAALGTFAVERLVTGAPLPEPHPLYLRRPDAQVPGATKRVRQWQQQ